MSFISPGEARVSYLRANSLSELLAWNDVDFVRCAYVTILGRQPDAEGERHYTDRIRHGCSKMKVLWQLRTSRERPRHDPGIAGLDRALRRAKRKEMPFVGVFFRLWTGDEGDEAAAKRHRMVANELGRVMGLQQRLLEEQNKLLGRIDRPSVILPSAVQVANDGRASPQDKAVTTSHAPKTHPPVSHQIPTICRLKPANSITSLLALAEPRSREIS